MTKRFIIYIHLYLASLFLFLELRIFSSKLYINFSSNIINDFLSINFLFFIINISLFSINKMFNNKYFNTKCIVIRFLFLLIPLLINFLINIIPLFFYSIVGIFIKNDLFLFVFAFVVGILYMILITNSEDENIYNIEKIVSFATIDKNTDLSIDSNKKFIKKRDITLFFNLENIKLRINIIKSLLLNIKKKSLLPPE